MTRLAVFVATVGYCGYFPVAPGTVGSAAGLVFYLLVWWAQSPVFEVVLIALLFAAGVWAGTTSEITLAFIPVGLKGALIGFVLFRIFDVIKPFPARRFEALHGGLGVMADDAMAAIYANICLRIILYLRPGWL